MGHRFVNRVGGHLGGNREESFVNAYLVAD